jgi:hypothetical protein
VPLDETSRLRLLDTLIADGWTSEGDFIYAPRRTMWLLRSSPWEGDLAEMHERMQGRLDRIRTNALTGWQDSFDDTARLVQVLGVLTGRS